MEEIWKDIKGYDGLYQVSNFGRIKRVTTGRILKGSKDSIGYIRVNLHKNNIPSTEKVHRLVAEAFIPNLENKPQVNHRDEDKTNNMASNLEWMTAKENINHGTCTQRISKSNSVPIIATNVKTGKHKDFYGLRECSRQLGLSHGNISQCLNGKRKTVGGFILKYKEV